MQKPKSVPEELIAPCGMNCAGCRPQNKRCTYLFRNCEGSTNIATGNVDFCFECDLYPCKQIERMDKRYRNNYGISIKENLEFIKNEGISRFIDQQYKKYHCPECGELISIHNRKCFKCDTITRLVEKLNKKY